MKWNFLLSLALSISFLTTASNAEDVKQTDPTVATVNNVEIKKSEFDKYYNDKLNFVGKEKATKESALNDLIDRIIGIENAKKNNIHKDPTVIRKMNEVLYHAQISRDLEGKLLKIKVNDSEVAEYYKNNPEYHTAQILLRLRTNPSPSEVSENMSKANTIYQNLTTNNEDFSKAAAKYGQTANSLVGGDLGFQPKTRLTPEYYEAIKGKSVGFITKPFRSQYGIHIVKVLGVKKFDQIDTNMYKKIIYDIKRDKILADYFKENRKKANIKIFKDKL